MRGNALEGNFPSGGRSYVVLADMSVCPSVDMLCLSVCMYAVSVCPSACMLCLSVCLSVWLSVCHLSISVIFCVHKIQTRYDARSTVRSLGV